MHACMHVFEVLNAMRQNPPSIPTLIIGALISRLISASFVIDWHNYGKLIPPWRTVLTSPGHTILALSQGARSPLVRLAHRYGLSWIAFYV